MSPPKTTCKKEQARAIKRTGLMSGKSASNLSQRKHSYEAKDTARGHIYIHLPLQPVFNAESGLVAAFSRGFSEYDLCCRGSVNRAPSLVEGCEYEVPWQMPRPFILDTKTRSPIEAGCRTSPVLIRGMIQHPAQVIQYLPQYLRLCGAKAPGVA